MGVSGFEVVTISSLSPLRANEAHTLPKWRVIPCLCRIVKECRSSTLRRCQCYDVPELSIDQLCTPHWKVGYLYVGAVAPIMVVDLECRYADVVFQGIHFLW